MVVILTWFIFYRFRSLVEDIGVFLVKTGCITERRGIVGFGNGEMVFIFIIVGL